MVRVVSAARARKAAATSKKAAARRSGRRSKPVDERALTESRAKERRAWELFVRGATPAQVAVTTWTADGRPMYESESGARAAIERAAAYLAPIEETTLLRDQMIASLMADLVECNRILNRRHPVLDRDQRVVMLEIPTGEEDENGQPVMRREMADDDGIKVRVMAQKNRIWDQVARLQGIYSATRFEVSGPEGGPIELAARREKLLERAAEIKLLPTAGERIVDVQSSEAKEA